MAPQIVKGVVPPWHYRFVVADGRAAIRFVIKAIPENPMPQQDPQPRQLSGCFVRLLWMMVGNVVLIMTAIAIAQKQRGFALTEMDAFFFATAIGLLVVRYIDIRFLQGKTSDSQPATMADWRRYAITILGVSFLLWLGVHAIS